MRSRPHERHAWLLLLAASVPWLYGPLANLVQGEPLAAGLQFWRHDPANESAADWAELVAERPDTATVIAGYNRMTAVFALTYGLTFVTVVCTAYRRGERWSWFVAWTYPAALIGFVAVATAHHGWAADEESWAVPSIMVLVGAVLPGLLLPIRLFFGGDRPQHGAAGRAAGT
jgi:cytochrome bd-type quinol oxidase subunit 1